MKINDSNTKQIILEAAEAEFLEKGYGSAKMLAIAKRANVSHSMLHYYFSSKENLFQTIFLQKSQIIVPLLENIFEQQLPFLELVRNFIETQFNFLRQNPKIPHFILSEILTNEVNRALLFEVLSPKIINVFGKFEKAFNEEVEKGVIRPLQFKNFIMNIVSINVSTFILLPVLEDIIWQNGKNIEDILNERRESNVQFVLSALKP